MGGGATSPALTSDRWLESVREVRNVEEELAARSPAVAVATAGATQAAATAPLRVS
jgi:hypothetical protein